MNDIKKLRNKIDEVTLDMVRLLKSRMDLAKEIGDVKKHAGKNITDESREASLRDKVLTLAKDIGLDERMVSKLLNFLLVESIKEQSKSNQTHLSIFLKAKELEEKGKKIIHMEVGQPDFSPPPSTKYWLQEALDKGFVKYGPSKGILDYRKALAEKCSNDSNVSLSTDNIIVSPGARFAIYAAITTLLNPGDEIIIIEPAWPAYRQCALNAGIKVKTVQTTLMQRWEPNLEEIENMISKSTKMIVLNYPNNPTGKILPEKIQDEIIEIAVKNNLYVLSDEVYSMYAYKPWKSVLRYEYEKSIITQSFSKSHSMTGFRIGHAIANSQIIDKMTPLFALCITNVAEPIQYAAWKALTEDTSDFAKIMKKRIDVISAKAKDIGLEYVNPDGSMYLFARVNKPGFDSMEFASKALEEGLAVAPGVGFGDYRDFIRVSACQNEKTLIEGMNIIDRILRDEKWIKKSQ